MCADHEASAQAPALAPARALGHHPGGDVRPHRGPSRIVPFPCTARVVEVDRRLPAPRGQHRPALGTPRRASGSPAGPPKGGIGLRVHRRGRRVAPAAVDGRDPVGRWRNRRARHRLHRSRDAGAGPRRGLRVGGGDSGTTACPAGSGVRPPAHRRTSHAAPLALLVPARGRARDRSGRVVRLARAVRREHHRVGGRGRPQRRRPAVARRIGPGRRGGTSPTG